MKLLLFASCAATLGVCGYTMVELQSKLDRCTHVRAELEKENAELIVRTLNRESDAATEFEASAAADRATNDQQNHMGANEVQADAAIRVRLWSIERGIKEVQEVLALDTVEQGQLRQALEASIDASGVSLNRDALEKIVRETLGDEKALQLTAGFDQREAQELNRRVLKDTAFYAKSLRLSPEQEELLEGSIRLIELELKPRRAMLQNRMRQAMGKHFGGNEAKQDLQEDYDQIEAMAAELDEFRIDAILNAMQDELSDQQKNQLLEMKAEALH